MPLISPALFLQYEDVLERPEQRRVSQLSNDQVDQRLTALAAAAEPVSIHYLWRPQLPDRAMNWCSETAINGMAEVLVTYDIRDFASAAPRFGLRLARPADLPEELAPGAKPTIH